MESIPPKEIAQTELQERVAEKIKFALDNAMPESRFSELHKKVAEDITNGTLPEDKKTFEEEILRSTVVAETLPEYKEVLMQAEILLHEDEGWAIGELAHENAHANVGLSLNFKWIGYGLLFVKDEAGVLLGVNPNCIIRPQSEWTEGEYHSKSIEMLDAPRMYGETLSPGDIKQIGWHKDALANESI